MKNRVYILFLSLCVALVCGSCSPDTGNYDYVSDGKALEHKFTKEGDYGIYGRLFTVGEEIVVDDLEITIIDKTLKESDLKYEWYLDEVVAIETDEPVFRYSEPVPVGTYRLVCIVRDTRYDMAYVCDTQSVTIVSEYTDGWAVLGEEGGSSVLGYVRYANEEFQPFVSDVYALNNDGETLSGQPVALSYHIYQNSIEGYQFALNITQNGGVGPVDLRAATMVKYADVAGEFSDGIPALKSMSYLQENVFALSEAGDVYIRYEAKISDGDHVPHATKFSKSPVYIEGGMNITHWLNYTGINSGMMFDFNHVLAYDDLHKRIIKLEGVSGTAVPIEFYNSEIMPGDPGTDGTNEYPELAFPGPDDLGGYEMLFMTGYGSTWDDAMSGGSTIRVASVLKNTSDNKYYFFSFGYVWDWSDYSIELDKFYELPIQDLDQDVVSAGYFGGEYFVFFTANDNKDLYLMNVLNGYDKLLYSSATPITAIKAGETSSLMAAWGMGEPGPYYRMLSLGTEDGKFIVLDVSPSYTANNASTAPELKSYDTGMDKIVAIEFMGNDALTASSVSSRSLLE